MHRLCKKCLSDIAIRPLLLASAFRRVGPRVDETDPEHRTGARQPAIRERCAVVTIEDTGHTPANERPTEQLLAGPGVLVGEESAVDNQAGVGSDRSAVSASRLIRFSGPPSEPDVRVSTHPALHKPMPLDYAAFPSVVAGHGAGMFFPR